MKLILKTTKSNLIYQRDNEHSVVMYGSAAGIGVQFNDDLGTTVRAYRTCYLGVDCISINQEGFGHRDFYVPTGTPITLDGTKVTPRKYQQSFSPHSDRKLYQHHFSFKRAKQAEEALNALLDINIIAMHVRRSGHCRILTFQTPYPLGPILRGVLSHELRPTSAFFNRRPLTWEPYRFFQRVTKGQVILTMTVFVLFCGLQFLRLPNFANVFEVFDFWDKIIMGLVLTTGVGWISSDLFGLARSSRTFAPSRLREDVQQ